jgi:predicted nucleic acid-binding protein
MTKRYMASKILLDTGMFKALVDPKDEHHQQSITLIKQLSEEMVMLVTTNYILDEAFTLIRVRCGLTVVKKFRESLRQSLQQLDIVRVTTNDEAEAWKWFLNDWRNLSFTDCVTFAVMKRLGLTRAAAFDEHFRMAGFEVLS